MHYFIYLNKSSGNTPFEIILLNIVLEGVTVEDTITRIVISSTVTHLWGSDQYTGVNRVEMNRYFDNCPNQRPF